MIMYRMYKISKDIQKINAGNIRPGCVYENGTASPLKIGELFNKERAFKLFDIACKSAIYKNGDFFEVIEYYMEQVEIDENGNDIRSEIVALSKMVIHVVDKESCEVVGTFSEMAAAMAFVDAVAASNGKSAKDYNISF